jgi:hypothetical protein
MKKAAFSEAGYNLDAELVEAGNLLLFSSRFDKFNDQEALLKEPALFYDF